MGEATQEAGFINKSLFILGKVIAGLAVTGGDSSSRLVPYRDSKLTKLLIGSLGGRGRTLMIACVRDGKANLVETLRTLKFSMACARIQSKPIRFLNPHEKLISDLRSEIQRLSNENALLKSSLVSIPRITSQVEETNSTSYDQEVNVSLPQRQMSSDPLSNDGADKIKELEERILRIELQSMQSEDVIPQKKAHKSSKPSKKISMLQKIPYRNHARGKITMTFVLLFVKLMLEIGSNSYGSSSKKPKKISSADSLNRRPAWDDAPLKPVSESKRRSVTPSPYIGKVSTSQNAMAFKFICSAH